MRNKKALNKMVFVENEEATDFLDPSAHKSVLGWSDTSFLSLLISIMVVVVMMMIVMLTTFTNSVYL